MFWLFVILVISRFGFEGRIWVLIASVPDLCVLLAFMSYRIDSHEDRFPHDRANMYLYERPFNDQTILLPEKVFDYRSPFFLLTLFI